MSELRKRDIALQGVTMLLALGVGVLIGARGCASSEESSEPEKVVERVEVEKIVYECPPEPKPEAEPEKSSKTVGSRKTDSKKKLPDADDGNDPLRRKRLLAWVRDRSSDLKKCNNATSSTYRLAVTFETDTEGRIRSVGFDAPPSEVPSNVQSCLRRQILSWTVPEELSAGKEKLVFGLTI